MNIDRMEFLAWMERLMNRLDLLGENMNDFHKNTFIIGIVKLSQLQIKTSSPLR